MTPRRDKTYLVLTKLHRPPFPASGILSVSFTIPSFPFSVWTAGIRRGVRRGFILMAGAVADTEQET